MNRRILFIALFTIVAVMMAYAQNPLAGKRIGVLGDSYVRNHREPVENTWHYKFAQRHGMQYYNYGRNGNCVSVDLERWGRAMVNRYQEMNDSLDYIVVIAGHNDATRLDSIGIDMFRKKLTELCDGLIERYPQAQIFFFTPWIRSEQAPEKVHFEQVVDAILEVCASRSIPVFDAYHHSNIYAQSDRFRDVYFQNGRRDTAHLNARGHDRFLPIAEHFIMQYIALDK